MATNTPIIAVAVALAVAGAGGWWKYLDERDAAQELSDEYQSRSQQLTADVDKTQRELLEAEQQLADTRQQMATLETAVRASREEAQNNARIEIERLSAELTVLGAERDILIQQRDEVIGERDSLLGKRGALEQERDQLLAQRELAVIERDLLMTEIGALSAQRDDLEARNEAFSAEVERLYAVQFEARQAVAALSEELNMAGAQRKRLTQELAAARGSEKAAREELERMQRAFARLAENEALVAEMSNALRKSSTDIDTLEAELARMEEETRRERERFAVLNTQLQGELSSRDVQVRQLENRLTMIRVGSDILFQSGSVELSDSGRQALTLIAGALAEYPDRKVDVEGHTDNVPIGTVLGKVYPSNWELSAARAAQAVRFLQATGIDPARLRAVGLGEHQPVSGNEDSQSRSRNRRIEFTLLPVAQRVINAE